MRHGSTDEVVLANLGYLTFHQRCRRDAEWNSHSNIAEVEQGG